MFARNQLTFLLGALRSSHGDEFLIDVDDGLRGFGAGRVARPIPNPAPLSCGTLRARHAERRPHVAGAGASVAVAAETETVVGQGRPGVVVARVGSVPDEPAPVPAAVVRRPRPAGPRRRGRRGGLHGHGDDVGAERHRRQPDRLERGAVAALPADVGDERDLGDDRDRRPALHGRRVRPRHAVAGVRRPGRPAQLGEHRRRLPRLAPHAGHVQVRCRGGH